MEPNTKKAPPSPQPDNDDDEGGDAKLVCALSNEVVEKILLLVAKDHAAEIKKLKRKHKDAVQGLKDARLQEVSDVTWQHSRRLDALKKKMTKRNSRRGFERKIRPGTGLRVSAALSNVLTLVLLVGLFALLGSVMLCVIFYFSGKNTNRT